MTTPESLVNFEIILRKISDITTSLAKMVGVVSFVVTLILIFSYTSKVSAPFPAIGAGFSLFATVFALVFVFFLLGLVWALLFPVVIKGMVGEQEIVEILPRLFSEKPIGKHRNYIRYLTEYAAANHMFLSLGLAFLAVAGEDWMFDGKEGINVIIWPLMALLIAGFASVILIRRVRRWSGKQTWIVLKWSIIISVVGIVWGIVIFAVSIKIIQPAGIGKLIVIVVVVVVMHTVIMGIKHSFRNFGRVTLALSFFALVIWPGAAFFGGATLRVLGLGGGIPATITMPKGTGDTCDVHGCIVLNVGDELVYQPAKSEAECKISKVSILDTLQNNSTHIETFSRVVARRRSDIVAIRKWDSSRTNLCENG